MKPLVISYARDLKILVVDDIKSNLAFYKVAFGKYFKVCDTALNGQEAYNMYKKDINYYDLIVTDIDMPILNGLELVSKIRENDINQHIVIITAVTDLGINQDLAFHNIDGLLTKPVDNTKLYTLLYRILKNITEKKELQQYIISLEDESNLSLEHKHNFEFIIKKLQPLADLKEVKEVISIMNVLVGKSESNHEETNAQIEKIEKKQISESVKKNIRYTHDTIISAKELVEDLDDSIIDKMEEFEEILGEIVLSIDKFSESKDISTMQNLNDAISHIKVASQLIANIGLFPIISNSLNHLVDFLIDITYDAIFKNNKEKLLSQMIFGLEDDLSKWSEMIFIRQDAPNVHYLDASIANNVLEIESIFNEHCLESDEDDLEFF